MSFLWEKELKRPQNCLQPLLVLDHVPCCPHLVLAGSSVLHHAVFQIQLLTIYSAHTCIFQKFFIFQPLVNLLSSYWPLVNNPEMSEWSYDILKNIGCSLKTERFIDLGRVKPAEFELCQHGGTLIFDGIFFYCFQDSDALNTDHSVDLLSESENYASGRKKPIKI